MKEYILRFGGTKEYNLRKLLTSIDLAKWTKYIGRKDVNGIILLSIEEIK